LKQILFKIPTSPIPIPERNRYCLASWFLGKQRHVGFFIQTLLKKPCHHDLLGHGETECLSYVQTMEDNADAVTQFYQNCASGAILSGILWAVMSLWLLPNYIQTR
jgi:hypothetical protein